MRQEIPKQETLKTETKNKIISLPSGAVVELDARGDVVRTIKDAPVNTATEPSTLPISQPIVTSLIKKGALEIVSVIVAPDINLARIEWQTNQPTESKLYLSGGGISSKLFTSETGYTTNHFVNINQLAPITAYSFQITAIGNVGFTNVFGGFKTKTPPPTIKFDQNSHGISMGAQDKISWKSNYIESCSASGAWSGTKSINGEELVSFNQVGTFTYNLACTGLSGGTANAALTITVFDSVPKIIFYFNDTPSNTFSGKIGETVKLRWETSNTGGTDNCTASNSWNGSKYVGGSQDILLETAGEFSYTLTCVHKGSGVGRTNTATITVIQ